MRSLHYLMASCALVALALNDDQGSQPISAPSDGQIALTAHNNGDGTWSVKRGPNGPVLRDGLPREKALAIVGGATGPYEPENEQEAIAAADRAEIEAQEARREETEIFASDADTGEPLKVGRASDAALADENAKLREENEALKVQVAKFDRDGDGNTGGSAAAGDDDGEGLTKAEIIADLEGMGAEFDPKALKADLLAQRNEARAKRDATPPDGVEGAENNGGE